MILQRSTSPGVVAATKVPREHSRAKNVLSLWNPRRRRKHRFDYSVVRRRPEHSQLTEDRVQATEKSGKTKLGR